MIIRKIVEKSFQNPPETLPQRSKIEQKFQKIDEKIQHEWRQPKNAEKMRKNSPTWPQEPPKREGNISSAVYALPCLAPNLESKKH